MLSEFDRRTIAADVADRLIEAHRKGLVSDLAGRVAEIMAERFPTAVPDHPVLPVGEAIRYIGRKSRSSFKLWYSRWGVSAVAYGRFSPRRLETATDRKSKGAYRHGKEVAR